MRTELQMALLTGVMAILISALLIRKPFALRQALTGLLCLAGSRLVVRASHVIAKHGSRPLGCTLFCLGEFTGIASVLVLLWWLTKYYETPDDRCKRHHLSLSRTYFIAGLCAGALWITVAIWLRTDPQLCSSMLGLWFWPVTFLLPAVYGTLGYLVAYCLRNKAESAFPQAARVVPMGLPALVVGCAYLPVWVTFRGSCALDVVSPGMVTGCVFLLGGVAIHLFFAVSIWHFVWSQRNKLDVELHG